MKAAELIKRGAMYFPEHTAVIFEGQSLTFKEVYKNSNRLANALLDLGLKKGDRVAFLLANSLKSVEIDFAILLAGLVRVPLNARLSEKEHLHMIDETDSMALLFTEEFSDRAKELQQTTGCVKHFCQINGTPADESILNITKYAAGMSDDEPKVKVEDSDLATIQYTSGTTGVLKAAVHTQQTWGAISTNILTALDIREGDIMMHAAPLTHASGTLVLPHWVRGAANAILPGFEPDQYLKAIEEIKPTTLNLVPTMVVMLLSHPESKNHSLDSVRNIIYGASPMPREALKAGMNLWGPKFIQYYGQTEAPLILSLLEIGDHQTDNEEAAARLISCGRPVATTSIKICDEEGKELPLGDIGEIVVNSTQGMIGYWNAPELTAETIKDGWIFTRDMGYIDERGYLFLVDRKSDMIISGGFNIYPREVEEVLYEHPAVLEAAAIGTPDPKWVETVTAYVVLRPGASATEEEIIEFCKDKLASYKKPTSVHFIDSLPKTAVGKVLRRALKKE